MRWNLALISENPLSFVIPSKRLLRREVEALCAASEPRAEIPSVVEGAHPREPLYSLP
jgi:hypothetical protein